jgi:putative transposase
MKSSKFSESRIIRSLKENEQGRSVGDLSRELGIDKSTSTTGERNMVVWNGSN